MTTRPSTRGTSCTTTYRKFLGKMASYLFQQFFQLHKSYENAIGTRNSRGTTRANRKNWPTEFRKPTVLKLKRGESRKMQHEDVTAVVWLEKRVVRLLSTNSDPRTDGDLPVIFSVQGTGGSPTGQIQIIAWVIKRVEAKVCEFLVRCKC